MTSDVKAFEYNELGECIQLIIDHRGKTPRKLGSDWVDDGVPTISAKNVNSGKLVAQDAIRYVTPEIYKKWMKEDVQRGDCFLVSEGATLGECLYWDNDYPIVLGQRIFCIRTDPEVLYPRYFYAYMTSAAFQSEIIGRATGSSVPGLRQTEVLKLKVKLLPMEQQIFIGDMLYNINKKIDKNTETNQTLEQIAQAIFKSWFVDFEPVKAKAQARASVEISQNKIDKKELEAKMELAAICAISGKTEEQLKGLDEAAMQQLKTTAALFPDVLVETELGEIPEGWDVSKLGELLEFNPKRTLKKGILAPYLDMKNIPTQGHLADDVYLREMASGTKFINGDTLLARITPCLENGKTAYVDFLEEEQVGWGSTEYIIMRPRNGWPLSLGYIIARLDSFRAKAIQTMTGTSGRQRANAKALSDQSWIDYPTSILKVYDLVAGGYLDKAKINGNENKILSELRDALLPKLLTGEIFLGDGLSIEQMNYKERVVV